MVPMRSPEIELARTPRAKQKLQVERLKKFKQKNAGKAEKALDELAAVVESGENYLPALLKRWKFVRSAKSPGACKSLSAVSGRWCRARQGGRGLCAPIGGSMSDPYSKNLRLHRLRDAPSTFFVPKSLRPKKPVLTPE